MDIGSVRLTERFGVHQGAAAAYIRTQLPTLAAERALGVDGTTAELAGARRQQDGRRLSTSTTRSSGSAVVDRG